MLGKPHINYAKFLGTILLSGYFYICITDRSFGHFIDYADLVIHEAGHFIFMFFGDFMHILGGSLLQVLIPLLFTGYFYVQKQFFSSSLILTWVGYNLTSVSIYMDDAIPMQLPLLGGDSVLHDWNTLFNTLGLLSYSHIIAHLVYALGMVLIIGGIVTCFILSFFPERRVFSYK